MSREEADEGLSSPLSDRDAFRRGLPWPQWDIREPPRGTRADELEPHAFYVEWQLPDAVPTR